MDMLVTDRAADAERYEVICAGFDPSLFAAAGIGTYDRVLDIGCGYGATTRRAARTASAGHVVGNDVVEPMLEQARAAAAAEGLANVTFESGDAQSHDFPAAAFDVAISRFGVMFFAGPVAAFANIGRSLRPGGRLVFATVGPPDGNDLPKVLAAAVREEPGAAEFGVYSLADPGGISDVLTRAGFQAPDVVPVETVIELGADAGHAADFLLGWGAFRGSVDHGDDAAVAAARSALTAAARPFETPHGVRLRSTAWLVSAVR